MSTGESNGTGGPNHDADPPSERTRFLLRLLDDQEHDRVRPVEDYVAEFEGIAEFVRSEHEKLVGPSTGRRSGGSLEFAPGRRIGRYELLRIVGEGGMGRAYLAKDPQLSREVVLKALRADEGPTDPGRERLRREARVLGRLHHPHLAEVLDVLEVDEGVFLVMPFYDGRPLAACLAEARARSERSSGTGPAWPRLTTAAAVDQTTALRSVIAFFAQAATALHAAHEAGVVHRDLKPQNVLVRDDGTPLVLDFGLALPAGDERLTLPGEVLGTPSYMAPEQIEGRAVDARADVYALAVMLYEALTLVQPFAGSGGREATFHRVLKGDPLSPRKHQPLVPRDLEAVVLKGMEREPARRYEDAAAFARELTRVLDLEPTEARPVSGFTRWMRKVVHRRRMAAVVGAAIAVSGTSLGYVWVVEAREIATLERNHSELMDVMRARKESPSGIGAELGGKACDFLKLATASVGGASPEWKRWCEGLEQQLLGDPLRTFAVRWIETKGEFAAGAGPEAIAEVVADFEGLLRGWPEDPREAPRRAWVSVAAARWVLWNARDGVAAERITREALTRLEASPPWPADAVSRLRLEKEFWFTEETREEAGTKPDAHAELQLLHASAMLDPDEALTAADQAVRELVEVKNDHRQANALMLRAGLLRQKSRFDEALADVEVARSLYEVGFTNHSIEYSGRASDRAGVASTQLELARIRLAQVGSRPATVSDVALRSAALGVEQVLGGIKDLTRPPAVLAEAPLLAAELWLATGDAPEAPDRARMRNRVLEAMSYYTQFSRTDLKNRAGALLTRLKQ